MFTEEPERSTGSRDLDRKIQMVADPHFAVSTFVAL
jgi:hypothetical protein